ncbi:hypothetical protein TREMEDRAFT_61965 [Tremella mesenterica DSM 1558]|uniref:uncharacterized protein n=1 Tax=Tremella mesenterica (strain ATCC 24925 / CBS 8224 / DSM 1558 / NBRC 9311 / NRRL Y-6157 / RJB 2259-6 / UBC 559-6) TaxID=578456 RepID=UPI00032D4C6A|nr:uncharacterized protein TREMEDRAFT_61965 [Tremella mesenterica DSM 1558]XP_007005740.1 uncharacterized protein TREMEDRAFT_63323 [Tremella mesenterica DSM 1558]XP_007006823.1 uncharacterized protein TREMEDRAFT_64497 [Tremella mesenterica DSM 1558]XP_007007550.1 uncharacterized protein TREMEDRAFT_65275 [Tremella mesenterica DSM 1558]EIW66423.1 hypothetical protein TREMEDRAFT_65275 [Tremella mesenterica DSM 1558]EIW67247.1 hypothetical protein TREMEDRAFT_64497 [Tremella mesenterica DSM 1558]E
MTEARELKYAVLPRRTAWPALFLNIGTTTDDAVKPESARRGRVKGFDSSLNSLIAAGSGIAVMNISKTLCMIDDSHDIEAIPLLAAMISPCIISSRSNRIILEKIDDVIKMARGHAKCLFMTNASFCEEENVTVVERGSGKIVRDSRVSI